MVDLSLMLSMAYTVVDCATVGTVRLNVHLYYYQWVGGVDGEKIPWTVKAPECGTLFRTVDLSLITTRGYTVGGASKRCRLELMLMHGV